MSTRPLRRVRGLDAELRQRLDSASVATAEAVLGLTAMELVARLHLSAARVAELVAVVSADLAPAPRTAFELWTVRRGASAAAWLPTGIVDLDAAMGGGIPTGSLTELVGDSGVGKTQLCLTLAARVAREPGAGVIYIDTEGKFSASRLVEIARGGARAGECSGFGSGGEGDSNAEVRAMAQRVTVLQCSSCQELAAHVGNLERLALERGARLVVIDSIAALARREYSGALAARQTMLSQQATQLKALAEGLDLPIVVTNQLNGKRVGGADDAGIDSSLVPALGNTWSHCINSRIFLRRVRSSASESSGAATATRDADADAADAGEERSIAIVKSPIAGVFTTRFVLDGAGVHS